MTGRKFGHEVSIKTRKKISIAFTGRKLSENHKEKIRLTLIGNKRSLGYKHTEESNEKRRKSHIGLCAGNKHPFYDKKGSLSSNWKGGLSKEGYPFNFNRELKELIRRRDNYICQKCSVKQNGRAHCVHHIDYDKENLDPINLTTLCHNCNVKVNANREYWKKYFQDKIANLN